MPSTSSTVPVRHNPGASRYEVEINGHLAVADYVIAGDHMILPHTYVPEALRGRGVAAALVHAALVEARGARLRVEPRCSYVQSFLERHTEFSDLVS